LNDSLFYLQVLVLVLVFLFPFQGPILRAATRECFKFDIRLGRIMRIAGKQSCDVGYIASADIEFLDGLTQEFGFNHGRQPLRLP
jgi:hypothetical protein